MLFSIYLFFTALNLAYSQDCNNPLGRYTGVSLLSFPITPESEYCSELFTLSCCINDFLTEINDNIVITKQYHDTYGDNFVDSIFELEESYWNLIDIGQNYFPTLFEELQPYEKDEINYNFEDGLIRYEKSREDCFEDLWSHKAASECLACSYAYSEFATYNPSSNIIVYELEYSTCTEIQDACNDYAEAFDFWYEYSTAVDWTARLLLNYREHLNLDYESLYTDIEIQNITTFQSNYTYLECLANYQSCFDFCTEVLTPDGFEQYYVEPVNLFFDWSMTSVQNLNSYITQYGGFPVAEKKTATKKNSTDVDMNEEEEELEEINDEGEVSKKRNLLVELEEEFQNMVNFFDGSGIKTFELNNHIKSRKMQSAQSIFVFDYSPIYLTQTVKLGNLTGISIKDKIASANHLYFHEWLVIFIGLYFYFQASPILEVQCRRQLVKSLQI